MVKSYKIDLDEKLLQDLREKLIDEGYGIQEGIRLILENYVNGEFDIHVNM